MIGTISFKNQTNGSYERMKIYAYNGDFYSDLESNEPCCEYEVDHRGNVLGIKSDSGAPKPSLAAAMYIAQEACSFLRENIHVSEARFKFVHGDLAFNPISYRNGGYFAPDITNMFARQGVYMLSYPLSGGEAPTLTVFEASLLSRTLNLCTCMILKNNFDMYFAFGNDIYIDTEVFLKSPLWQTAFRAAMRPIKGDYETACRLKRKFCEKRVMTSPRFKTAFFVKASAEEEPVTGFLYDDLQEIRNLKSQMLSYLSRKLGNRIISPSLVKDIITLACDEEVLAINAKIAFVMRKIGKIHVGCGVLPSESHVDFLTDYELMKMNVTRKCDEKYRLAAKVRMQNMKHKKPSPAFYNCFGEAVTKNLSR